MSGGRAPKAKGSAFERDVVHFLCDAGWPAVVRTQQGIKFDQGDVAGIPRWSLEAKNCRAIDLSGWSDQAERGRANAGTDFAAVIVKRRGHCTARSYVVMSLEQLAAIIRELQGIAEPACHTPLLAVEGAGHIDLQQGRCPDPGVSTSPPKVAQVAVWSRDA